MTARPRTRGDCENVPRPCPFQDCRHHLWPDLLKIRPGRRRGGTPEPSPPDITTESCTLDVADRGGVTLEEAGQYLGIVRERVRQLEEQALWRLGKALVKVDPGLGLPQTDRPRRRVR